MRLCLAPTQRGGLCQNYYDTCPVVSHRTRSAPRTDASEAARSAVRDAIGYSEADSSAPRPLADDERMFREMVGHASAHYGLEAELTIRDYWLIRTLYAWRNAVSDGYVRRRFPNPARSDAENIVGRFVFGGGTSLSAAWGITQRWSEDIDLVLSAREHVKARELRQACMDAFGRTSRRISGTYKIVDKGPAHRFVTLVHPQRAGMCRFDVSFKPLDAAPIWTQREPVMSMIGRVCDEEMASSTGGCD